MRIWDFTSYRQYLLDRLGDDGRRTGARKELAEAIPVHTTFISQVLKGKADLSLEQGEAVNQYLGHSPEEGEYFIYLLLKERAGSAQLRKRFEGKIQEMRKERLNISKRLKAESEIAAEDRLKFYSSYLYGAVHVLSSIPAFQRSERMAEALRLSRAQTQEIVDFLLRIGLLHERNGELTPGSKHVHLGSESEMVLRHHNNWRLHTLSNLQFVRAEDVHYSGCMSLSEIDAHKIKEILLASLKSSVDLISESKDQVAYVLGIDFYHLTR
jgi:uncharacterized protein (TIGR02147 family)